MRRHDAFARGWSGTVTLVAAAWLLGLPLAVVRAQPTQGPGLAFGASTELVYLRFHILRKGDYVPLIDKDQLRVLEDGKPRAIAVLESPGMSERRIPTEVTLALDVSSSVLDLRLLDEAMFREVLLASLSQAATVNLCAFGGALFCPVEPTREAGVLIRGFEEAIRFGYETRGQGTRLYSSVIDICADKVRPEKRQRALVILSDGLDNKGGKADEAVAAAVANDVRVYAIKVAAAFRATAPGLRGGLGGANRAMYDYRKFDLDKLAAETGGQAFEPGTLDRRKLAEILRKIATEVTMEHVVGYEPQGAATGKKHQVKVELVDKSLGSIRNGERTITR